MQATKKKKLFRYLGIFLKGLMLALTFWFIYNRIFTTKNLDEIVDYFRKYLSSNENLWMPVLAVLLVFANWAIETAKWRYLILKIENISFLQAFKAVISGVTVSVFTPNRIGEYAGRVIYIKTADRIEATLITVISSLGQLVITLLVGALALLFFVKDYYSATVNDWTFYIGLQLYAVLFILMILAFVNTSVLTIILSRIRFLRLRFKKYIQVFSYYRQRDLSLVLFLSFTRFLVFSIQYFLLLNYFGVEITLGEAVVLIPVYLITLTVIPTMTLAELGVREVVSITVFSVISVNEIGMVATVFAIWLINLAVPAIVGTLFVLQTRIFRSN